MRHTPLTILTVAALIFVACASIGNPDGGRYDEEPPVVVQCFPKDKSTGNNKKKLSILFNEFVKLENASEKVVVSPPQIESANIRADGKRIKIDLFDSLQANTTYTIDFSDAIEDNNEGNPMGNYTYSFSTGDEIDTMEIAGTVLNAEDLEPVKGVLVGLYPADSTFSDTLFTTTPLMRVSRTNGSGRFAIRGVKPGKYHAYALKDADGNYIFNQKSELIGWDTTTLVTSSKPDIRMDTIWRDTTHYDSIRVVPYTHYLPDDVVIRVFLEGGQNRYLLKTERPVPEYFTLYFTAPSDTLPIIEGLNFDEKCLVPEYSQHFDTITYWVTDTMFSYQIDTLAMKLTYLETDTLGQLVPKTDTLELSPKLTRAKQRKEQLDQIEEWNKEREKKVKKSKTPLPPEENPYEITYLTMTGKPAGSIDPNQNILFTASEPIAKIDTSKIHFTLKQDSNWIPVPYLFVPVEGCRKEYTLYAEWQPKEQYSFQVDSAAIVSVLGNTNKPIKQEFRVRDMEEYGALFVRVIAPKDTGIVVQLLSRGDKPMRQLRADKDGNADFFYLKPGEFFLRCFIDRNGNDKWDTGDYASGTQPEEVFYFPKGLEVKAKWDIEQEWNIRNIEVSKQKPLEITKQKPDKKKDIKSRNREREEEKRKGKSGKSSQGSSSSNSFSSPVGF